MTTGLRLEDAVNELCPWSGDPISADSLTLYRGQVVGFCNSGCRDKFEKATSAFDLALAANQDCAIGGYQQAGDGGQILLGRVGQIAREQRVPYQIDLRQPQDWRLVIRRGVRLSDHDETIARGKRDERPLRERLSAKDSNSVQN